MWPFNQYVTYSAENLPVRKFDYIVVGGGTAGCALASRLSENKDTTVLLVERGPVVTSWISRVPLLSVDYRSARSPTYKWQSAPQEGLNGARLNLVGGKAMGGTSKVNIFLYTRSVPGEYNAWAQAGRKNWSWQSVVPYFVKSETSLSDGKGVCRGSKGPWINQQLDGKIFQCIVESAKAAGSLGIPFLNKANNPNAPAVSCIRLDRTLDRKMHRQSTFDAFLPAHIVKDRIKNLYVCSETIVNKIVLRDGAAVGVHIGKEGGLSGSVFVSAKKEVILCAGAIATPQLLMLSGVGPEDHLQQHRIPVVKSLPGVGSHLQDHPSVSVVYKAPIQDTLHILEANPLKALWELLKYVLFGIGLFLAPNPQTAIFALSRLLNDESRTAPGSPADVNPYSPHNIPDIEIMPVPYNTTETMPKGLGKSHSAFSPGSAPHL
ncbi:hypothetical protein NM688_g5665 [Phlebia brevispora]|uniref:Uncharacterized protein n=1 Tax=Phlebia brevispora TaxID=194682 RepID=A0ACC1SRZ8_9APHY|nr:hypothetical protein NM688_g5665 [Phlebia brevispora]